MDEELILLQKKIQEVMAMGATSMSTGCGTTADLDKIEDLKAQVESRMRACQERTESVKRAKDLLKETEEKCKNISQDDLNSSMEAENARRQRYLYGIDIGFLLDCTGSMCSWIKTAGNHIAKVMDIAPSKFPNATTRIAFVGYRDHCDGDLRQVKYDFVEVSEVENLKNQILSLPATGGGDAPEDIAGGLKNVTELSWRSSTRLVIHIADAPCHGTKYHDCSDDSLPGGDKYGLVPEDLLGKLCSKRVDYYFIRINSSTDKMIPIFKEVYNRSGSHFREFNIGDNPSEFLPTVIKSVTSSMGRSESFKGKHAGLDMSALH